MSDINKNDFVYGDVIGIDHGNFQIKTVHSIFPTGLSKYSTEPYGADILEFNNTFYSINPIHDVGVANVKKTDTELNYLLSLIAISKEIEARNLPTKCSIDLAVGLPPGQYNKQLQHEFKQYLTKNRPVKYKFNNKTYHIYINRVLVLPQAITALPYTAENEILDYNRFCVIDIGGGTTEFLYYQNKKLDFSRRYSMPLGMIYIVRDAIKNINSAGISLTEEEIFNYLDEPHNSFLLKSDKLIIDGVLESSAKKIIATARQNDMDLSRMPVLFMGGGTVYLEKFFTEINGVVKAFFDKNIKSNVLAYEKQFKIHYNI